MAITSVSTNQQAINPVYNDAIWTVVSDNQAECNFKYICDIYVNGSMITRLKMQPNESGEGVFKVNRVVEDFISNNPPGDFTQIFVSDTDACAQYVLHFGEEYDTSINCDGSGTVVVDLDLEITDPIILWRAAIDYFEWKVTNPLLDYLDFTFEKYLMKDSTILGEFLTRQPSTVLIGLAETAELYFLIQSDTDLAAVRISSVSGATTTTDTIPFTLASPFSYNNTVQYVCVGPYQINKELGYTLVNVLTDYYTITLIDGSGNDLSVPMTYEIDDRQTHGEKVKFKFLNKLGGYDSYTFTVNDSVSYDIQRTEIDKYLQWEYKIGYRGRQNTSVTAKKSETVQSNWLTEEEANWLTDLYYSPDVYRQTMNPIHCFTGKNHLGSTVYLTVGPEIDDLIAGSIYFVDNYDKSGSDYEGLFEISNEYFDLYSGYELVGAVWNTNTGAGIFYLEDYQQWNLPIIITSNSVEEKKKFKTKNINHTISFEYSSNINLQRN